MQHVFCYNWIWWFNVGLIISTQPKARPEVELSPKAVNAALMAAMPRHPLLCWGKPVGKWWVKMVGRMVENGEFLLLLCHSLVWDSYFLQYEIRALHLVFVPIKIVEPHGGPLPVHEKSFTVSTSTLVNIFTKLT